MPYSRLQPKTERWIAAVGLIMVVAAFLVFQLLAEQTGGWVFIFAFPAGIAGVNLIVCVAPAWLIAAHLVPSRPLVAALVSLLTATAIYLALASFVMPLMLSGNPERAFVSLVFSIESRMRQPFGTASSFFLQDIAFLVSTLPAIALATLFAKLKS